MTPEQITQWAREAGFQQRHNTPTEWWMWEPSIKAFATIVRNAALEEAAGKCDEEIDNWFSAIAGQDACKDCAKEIRSMKL